MARLEAQGTAAVTLLIMAVRHFRALHTAASDPGGVGQGMGRLRPPVFGPRRDRMSRQAQGWGMYRLEQGIADAVGNRSVVAFCRTARAGTGHRGNVPSSGWRCWGAGSTDRAAVQSWRPDVERSAGVRDAPGDVSARAFESPLQHGFETVLEIAFERDCPSPFERACRALAGENCSYWKPVSRKSAPRCRDC